MISICKTFKFEAAHNLPKHQGKCHNLHGHSYKLEVEVTGKIHTDGKPDHGMIMDFGRLKSVMQPLIDLLDHAVLNAMYEYPTAEFMVESMAQAISTLLLKEEGTVLKRLRLWETDTSWAEWSME